VVDHLKKQFHKISNNKYSNFKIKKSYIYPHFFEHLNAGVAILDYIRFFL